MCCSALHPGLAQALQPPLGQTKAQDTELPPSLPNNMLFPCPAVATTFSSLNFSL